MGIDWLDWWSDTKFPSAEIRLYFNMKLSIRFEMHFCANYFPKNSSRATWTSNQSIAATFVGISVCFGNWDEHHDVVNWNVQRNRRTEQIENLLARIDDCHFRENVVSMTKNVCKYFDCDDSMNVCDANTIDGNTPKKHFGIVRWLDFRCYFRVDTERDEFKYET